MVKSLLDQSYEVIVLDNLSTGHKSAVDQRAVFIKGDVIEEDKLDEIFERYSIECVMHFAANCYVGESIIKPLKYYKNNVNSSICLLNKMLEHKVTKIVFSSSCATYGTPNVEKIDESCHTNPINPYGRSKLMTEQIVKDISKAHQFDFIFLRYFNVAGADPSGKIGEHHDPETHLIPNILLHLLGKKDRIVIHGDNYPTEDGTCIRDFIHISDLVEAHLLSLESLINNNHRNEIYNVGSNHGYSIKEVIKMCEEVTGKQVNVVHGDRREGDPPKLVASNQKIYRHLGWKPKYPLRDIIKTAWNWHFNNPNGYQG